MNNPFRSACNMPDNCFSTPYDNETCPRCDREIDGDELIEVKCGELVCEYCIEDYVKCKHCDTYVNEDDVSELNDVCSDCYEELYFQCPICGKDKLIDDNEHYEENNNILCDECYEDLKHL